MNKYLKEFLLWILILLPYAYLIIIWESFPGKVPTHFGIDGQADRWSDKSILLFLPALIGMGTYLLMLIIPALDPKKRIQEMGDKYYNLRFLLTLFGSLLTTYILYVTHEGGIKNPNILIALIATMFAMLGNYFQAIRPNYFIGIRTPWTLESEEVWKKTHQLAGKLWMAGGIVIVLLSFIITNSKGLAITFGGLLFIMVMIPVIFSYSFYQQEKKLKT
jgi:uncharacterized membrane protein